MERKTFSFSRKIGNTLYRANTYCSSQSTESIEEKLMRLVRHDMLDIYGNCGIIKVPQMSRQSERNTIYGCQAG